MPESENWRECALAADAERDRLARQVADLEAALDDACDVAIWMSGSADFSPDGVAHEGWQKMRPKLYAAMAALAAARSRDPQEGA